MGIKLSVIVLIYNVELYLEECLHSLHIQPIKDAEFLLINDGSTDSSPSIAKKYVQKDSRFRLISKPNQGYGHSVNLGIQQAQGEYIALLEADDWLEPDVYSSMLKIADQHQTDLVKATFYECYPDGRKNLYPKPFSITDQVISPLSFPPIFYHYHPSIWSAIYRRQFLVENQITCLETPGASFQDTSFHFKVLIAAQRIILLNAPIVNYRQDNAGSSKVNTEKVFCVVDEYQCVKNYLAKSKKLETYRKVLQIAKFHTYTWNFDRVAVRHKDPFLYHISKEFQDDLRHLDLDDLDLSPDARSLMLKIAYRPHHFLFQTHLKRKLRDGVPSLIRLRRAVLNKLSKTSADN